MFILDFEDGNVKIDEKSNSLSEIKNHINSLSYEEQMEAKKSFEKNMQKYLDMFPEDEDEDEE